MALTGKEVLFVIGIQNNSLASETEQTTTQDIANLGGGGGVVHEEIVSSGTTHTTTQTNTFVGWNSATSGNKTSTIPASTGSKNIITIADMYGNAGTYSIQAVPASGPAIIGSAYVYTNNGSIELYDSSVGWCSI